VLPVSKPKKAPVSVNLSAVVVTAGRGAERKLWLVKADDALFGGLWGVPMSAGEPDEALRAAGLCARLRAEQVGKVEHMLTHRRLRVAIYRATGGRGEESETRRPFRVEELDGVGVSTLTRKLLEAAYHRD
jgi:A/G-specific adenine glycosylase